MEVEVAINIMICDDNYGFVQMLKTQLRDYCALYDYECSISTFTSPKSLLKQDLSMVQILFLDIDMPGQNGIEVAQILRESLPELMIIYVTAWIQYAPYGYRVSAFRYLLKQNLDIELIPCLDDAMKHLNLSTDTLSVATKTGTYQIAISHILYLEGAPSRKFYLHTINASSHIIECTGKLTALEQKLEGKGFFRIQRSYLVNLRHVRQISNYKVIMNSGEELTVSKHLYSAIRSEFAIWRASQL